VVIPAHVGERRLGLRTGGIHHEDVDRAQSCSHGVDESGYLRLVGHVGAERLRQSTAGSNGLGHFPRPLPAMDVVHRDGQAITGKPLRDRAPQPAGATRDEGDSGFAS
jgi:hypothetical protein